MNKAIAGLYAFEMIGREHSSWGEISDAITNKQSWPYLHINFLNYLMIPSLRGISPPYRNKLRKKSLSGRDAGQERAPEYEFNKVRRRDKSVLT